MKKFLITGGAGFLGYHLAAELGRRGEGIIIFDIAPIDLKEYPAGVVYIKGDVRDAAALRQAAAGVEVIIHAAAALPLCRASEIKSVSVDGTKNVLAAAKEAGIPRLVYVSSTAVYGVPRTKSHCQSSECCAVKSEAAFGSSRQVNEDSSLGLVRGVPKKHPIEEIDQRVGVGPYGESKIAAEKLCEVARAADFCVPIIRPKTFIGTGRLGVFQILFDWLRQGRRIPVIGTGTNRYQLLEVSDLVKAILLAATAPRELANDTFNVGAKQFGRVKDDVAALCAYARSGSMVLPTPAWLVKPVLAILRVLKLSPLYKWVYATADRDSFVSTEKIERQLGWQPRFSNAAALTNAYQWYLDHWPELQGQSGVTHRVAWKQGVLGLLRRFL